ncbi:AMP deaminase-like [Wolffia australiana]
MAGGEGLMEAYVAHLAMAALVGASIVAMSAYFVHRKTLAQVLEFARAERDRTVDGENFRSEGEEKICGDGDDLLRRSYRKRNDQKRYSRLRAPGLYQRGSASLPDVRAVICDDEDGFDQVGGTGNGQSSVFGGSDLAVDRLGLTVPSHSPRLHILTGGNSAASMKRPGSALKLALPTSNGSYTKTRVEVDDFEEENLPTGSNVGTAYLHANGTAELDDHINSDGIKKPSPAANMIRSHSVSGDLHGVPRDPVAADIFRNQPEEENFITLKITPTEIPTADEAEVYMTLQECLKLRENYLFREDRAPWVKEIISDPCTPRPNPNPFMYTLEEKTDHHFQMEDGMVHVYADKNSTEKLFPVADATTFFTDLHRILRVIAAGNARTVCHRRLVLLEQKFNMHLMLNADAEFLAQKSAPHRDFYNVRKVDTHVHHSACMNQKHLLRFIKSKLRKEPDEVVIFRDGTYMTLKEVFESLDLTGYDLNVDLLDVHADKSTFHRFDKFNLKYNPCGQSRLREIFLKQENLIQGRFLAQLTKEVFSDLAASKYQMAEYRISIYGRKQSEWDHLASWIVNNELYSENVVWLIQFPRLYNIYREMGIVTSFQNILDNIFLPLFEVTVDPDSHPQLHVFLKQVVGFDLVDDESKPERRPTKHMPTPAQWTNVFNPAFSYYLYYCYANLYTLNKLRESKGMTTIKLRPHSGEAGDIDHLAATFLTSHNIAHGINLRKSPVLQYLYYLAQIGLAMSPLSNNSLFLDYHRNPFQLFFQRGLNVSLSTDDPLQIHLTKEPLVEEYSIAASVWKLSSCDLCEIARNSVYQSGFSHAHKSHWLGKMYYKRGPTGNNVHKSNVPYIRVEFREMIWREEMQLVHLGKVSIAEEIDA